MTTHIEELLKGRKENHKGERNCAKCDEFCCKCEVCSCCHSIEREVILAIAKDLNKIKNSDADQVDASDLLYYYIKDLEKLGAAEE